MCYFDQEKFVFTAAKSVLPTSVQSSDSYQDVGNVKKGQQDTYVNLDCWSPHLHDGSRVTAQNKTSYL